MKMKKRRYSEGIDNDLDQALTENAVAQASFRAMTEEEQQKFRRRAEEKHGMAETRKLADSLAGWQEGHPPYQL